MRGKKISDSDIIGKTFNNLTVINFDKYENKVYYFNCLCQCGEITSKAGYKIMNGHTKSCGCSKYKGIKQKSYEKYKPYIGQKFGSWTVLEILENRTKEWKCICECGTIKSIANHTLFKGTSTSCGCNRPIGEDHYNWNSNLTFEERLKNRDFSEYINWRNSVYLKDDFTCQISNVKGNKIQAHHIYPWSLYPNLRLDVSNGVTLTKSIHKLFHDTYGYFNDTSSYFEEFKERYQRGDFIS